MKTAQSSNPSCLGQRGCYIRFLRDNADQFKLWSLIEHLVSLYSTVYAVQYLYVSWNIANILRNKKKSYILPELKTDATNVIVEFFFIKLFCSKLKFSENAIVNNKISVWQLYSLIILQAEEIIIEKYLHFACSEINIIIWIISYFCIHKLFLVPKKNTWKFSIFIDLSENLRGKIVQFLLLTGFFCFWVYGELQQPFRWSFHCLDYTIQ